MTRREMFRLLTGATAFVVTLGALAVLAQNDTAAGDFLRAYSRLIFP